MSVDPVAANATALAADIPNSATALTGASASSANSSQLRRRAVEFESMLLANVLEKLEQTYSGVPGSESADAAHDSQMSLATQAISAGLAKAGGVGIARMILKYLPQEGMPVGSSPR